MLKLILAIVIALFVFPTYAQVSGAGATFPYPLYSKWAEAYKKETGVSVNYQSIGSGGGIKQIQSKTVDFGATDMPLSQNELDKFGLTQFPTVIGAIVPVVNISNVGPGKLKLTAELIADIYLGKIKKWNDSRIVALNPDLGLPNLAITPVYRSDGSGTTFIFTSYLQQNSKDFGTKIGANSAVEWPEGVGGKGNEGVAAIVTKTSGTIGYVEYAYAKQNKLSHSLLKNSVDQFVQPNLQTFQDNEWPIVSKTYILIYKTGVKKEVKDFFQWALNFGDKFALDLDYVPLTRSEKTGIIGNFLN